MFRGDLQRYSREGRKFRERSNKEERTRPVHVYGMEKPIHWADAFKDDEVNNDGSPAGRENGSDKD